MSAAASPLSGSEGFGYRKRWGRKASNMLIISYMGDQVWLMTSRQTEPDLVPAASRISDAVPFTRRYLLSFWIRRGSPSPPQHIVFSVLQEGCSWVSSTHSSSMLGWKMRFVKPMLGDLYGYWSGSSTCTFQTPPSKGAARSSYKLLSHNKGATSSPRTHSRSGP